MDAPKQNAKAGEISPTKPQGILMTPGTARNRKSVSFGVAVKDNATNPASKTGIPDDCPGKFPSPWVAKEPSILEEGSLRRTALTKTLENARDTKRRKTGETRARSLDLGTPQSLRELDIKAGISAPQLLEGSQQADQAQTRPRSRDKDDFEGDMTLDLNEPHSQSGRYWKSEYERYHEDAKTQMKKLVRYKQLAKSYAKKKDEEAIDLGDKLKEEQEKALQMEEKITELIGQITEGRQDGNEDDSPAMMKDLARQTALAVQYREQVNQFRTALENQSEGRDGEQEVHLSPTKASRRDESNSELRRAREQLREMSALQAEMHSLRIDLSVSQKKASKLGEENDILSREVAEANEKLSRSEDRRHTADSQSQNRAQLLQGLQRDYDNLKESAKAQRRDAEHLLKKRHDQVSELKKEIATLKANVSSATNQALNPLMAEKGTYHKYTTVSNDENFMPMKTRPKSSLQVSRSGGADTGLQEHGIRKGTREANKPPEIYEDEDNLEDSKIPVLGGSTVNQRRSRTDLRSSVDESKYPRPKSAALGEIANNKNGHHLLETGKTASDLSLRQRFADLYLDSPKKELPLPEPLLSQGLGRTMPQKQVAPSPRQSMYNFPSETRNRGPRSSGTTGGGGGAGNRASNMPPSRLSSMASTRSRTMLDPERAAAAKARLDQRNAEKRRARESTERKENARI